MTHDPRVSSTASTGIDAVVLTLCAASAVRECRGLADRRAAPVRPSFGSVVDNGPLRRALAVDMA
jgi:hypothetical protein